MCVFMASYLSMGSNLLFDPITQLIPCLFCMELMNVLWKTTAWNLSKNYKHFTVRRPSPISLKRKENTSKVRLGVRSLLK